MNTAAQTKTMMTDEQVDTLAELARDCAAMGKGIKVFHGDRAYISSVYDYIVAKQYGAVAGVSLEVFKKALIIGNRRNIVRLTRADLVGAMDGAELERSSTCFMGAEFHFVAVDG